MRMLALLFLASGMLRGAEMNWVLNGDFSIASGWGENLKTEKGPHGLAAVLENQARHWTALRQNIELPQPSPPALEVSGWMKNESVKRGGNSWEVARITVVFYDKAGMRLGDWPAAVAESDGTHDWAFYSNQYSLPKGTAKVELTLLLDNCTGKAWYSDIHATVYDYDLSPLPLGGATHPEKSPPAPTLGENWLVNPGFELPGSRDWNGGRTAPGGHGSLHSLYVNAPVPGWNQPDQWVSFKGQHPASVVVSGWMKTRGVVKGAENYMCARIGCDFRDLQNVQKGGWQASIAEKVGDTPWTFYEKTYKVPEGSEQVQVYAGLAMATGEAWFDDLSVKLLDAGGKALTTAVSDRQVTDTSDWYAYTPPALASGTALDLSFLNEKPAGQHGFVSAKGGHFAFADGTRIRFWGTDFVGPSHFMEHAEADALALRLAKLGVNLVRLHMPDAAWSETNLFDPAKDDTLEFKADRVEKLDYLLFALKQNGIYVYPDWIVARRFRKNDGVKDFEGLDDGAKGAVHFDRRIIELNKLYATQLLGHVNPYTKLALKDDPIYVGNEIVNESSIFSGFSEQKLPESYWAELQQMYKAWGGKGKMSRFKFAWETQNLQPLNNPENADASLRFLYDTVAKSNLEMKEFQRGLSPHALLAGSNMGLPVLGNLKSDALLDFMDTHAYWDHPQIWNIEGGWSNVAIAPFDNQSQLKSPFGRTLLSSLAQGPVLGKAQIVTEWNDCFPNEYRLEGPVLMAAYASLQDWDGMLQFAYGGDKPGVKRMTNFDINTRPDNEPLYQIGALIFRQGLLKASDVTVAEPISDKALYENGMSSRWLIENPWLPYVVKVAKKFTGKDEEGPDPKLANLSRLNQSDVKIVVSITGEEALDYGKGILRIDAPKARGFAGGIGTGELLQAGDLGVQLDKRNPWAAVILAELDANQSVLVAVARAENSAQVYNATRTALKNPGEAPVLMQGVQGKITLKVTGKAYAVSPLDQDGKKGPALKASLKKGLLSFDLSPKDKTGTYLIEALR